MDITTESDKIILSSRLWELEWTMHAYGRTYDRRSHPKIANTNLLQLLSKMDSIVPDFIKEVGEQAVLRSFPDMTFYIIAVNAVMQKVTIITYGNVVSTFPKIGDNVFTVYPDGRLVSGIWRTRSERSLVDNCKEWGKIS